LKDDERPRQPIPVDPWARWVAGLVGIAGLVAGSVAIFTRDLEAGPVALIAVGALFLLVGFAGVLPTRLKIGENEAEWQREIEESVDRIERSVPEVSTLLDTSGADLDAFLAGDAPEPGHDLARAGEAVGLLNADIRFLERRVGQGRVPPGALLEIGRYYLTQQDWDEAARYLEAYVRRIDADWEVYFSLGVAHANRRQGDASDRAALRAYDQALARMPTGKPTGLTPRLYSYRAAIKKRLGRLQEAKMDAELAKQMAERRYDRSDAIYNLACIHAMLGEHEEALREITELEKLGSVDLVRGHLHDYFKSMVDDPVFRSLVL
jgi:tetratricopeptide (TPR) repeat protein